ncbi:unnamed protein product [Cuscuta campestris]|uniref:Retrotransposon gag domain-containing protein n=1 Tax=Cuscuta campestris TaxID=132261 RepID=A0A484M2S0_9ASTE|nr:unnamed protein product [Cuscuta campestris]
MTGPLPFGLDIFLGIRDLVTFKEMGGWRRVRFLALFMGRATPGTCGPIHFREVRRRRRLGERRPVGVEDLDIIVIILNDGGHPVEVHATSESTPAIPLMMSSMGTTFAPITNVGSIGMIPIMSTPTPTPTTTMFPGSTTTPSGAFTPYPSAWAQFAADPANAQALQGYQQVVAMMQQAGGFVPFAYPGMTPPIMPPPVLTPSTFVPRMVPIHPVNLTGTMNEAAPSNVHEVDEAEQESAKLRLGPEMGRTSAMERLGGSRHAQSHRSRESETIHQDEEEAESQPRASAYTRLSYDEDDLDKIGSVARKLRALEEKVDEKAGTKKHTLAKSPFSARVHAQKLRRKVKLDVEKFTGKEDPNIHLDTFHNAAQMAGCTDAEECLLFFSSLRGRPVEWFNGLPHGKIGSFEKLAEVFRKKYQDNCIKRKKFTYLNTVGQREKETLTQFLTRWRDEVDKVEEMDDKTAMSLLMNAFRSGDLYTEFCRRPPSSYQEAYNTAWEYAEAEVLNKKKRELEEGYTKPKSDKLKKDDQVGGSKLKATYDGSVHQIRDDKKGEQPKRPWTEKWCTYHQSDSHNTADCRNVKAVLKEMALRGELGEGYATGNKDPKANTWTRHQGKDQGRRKSGKDNNNPDKEFIQMIVGGPEGGDTASQRKNWARSLHVAVISLESHGKQARREPITFTDRDLPRTGGDHNDPLVITMDINGADVARVLVDTGSSVNVLYLDAFKKLKLDRSMLRPLQTPLSGFTGASIEAEGQITLPVTLGSGNKIVTKQMRFVVVDIKCVHNAILARPGINQVRAIISMAHLCMKFYTPNGIGEERGDQKNARSCYLEAVKKMTRQFEQIKLVSQQVDKGDEKARIEPDANTEEIQIDASNPERKVKIGADLQEELRTEIVQVLTRYKSLFAWSVADMPEIDRSVICHRLSVLEGSRPVRQKKRFLARTNWLEELPHIIWAYRVTSRRATGETPFVLTYGCEARLPIEAKVMTFREKIYEEKGNEEDHLAELNLLEERRMVAEAKMIEYQQAAKTYHDNKVGPRYFQVGDEVLRRREASKPSDCGKLAKKWEGPYRVKAILGPGTYKLETTEGRELERCWNSHHLRKFYR